MGVQGTYPTVKKASTSYIVPGFMTPKPRKARYMSFRWSNCQHKVHWAGFTCEMGCINFREFY